MICNFTQVTFPAITFTDDAYRNGSEAADIDYIETISYFKLMGLKFPNYRLSQRYDQENMERFYLLNIIIILIEVLIYIYSRTFSKNSHRTRNLQERVPICHTRGIKCDSLSC